ncbi:RIMS-binding protein 2 isoform E [Patagioenas fasciata monilis]|uniref:RIMS-binding protein 2 n=1 Tax=Patagioenas fasciata monilis TaxID=372326 RepID=A0A1V4JSE7_PATFA|nr:RIMS-binding protein 2 isoform E [Patagioenas fasciata monilis]
MKATGHTPHRGSSGLDSPKANQSVVKADKPLTKGQEENKASKKGNEKTKQTAEKPPRCRSEGRSKQRNNSNVSPSTSSALSSNSAAGITKAITGTLPLQQQMHFVNVEPQHLQNENKQSESTKHLEVALLRAERGGLGNRLGCPREGLVGQKPGNTEELLKRSQQELLWLQRQLCIHAGGAAGPWAPGKALDAKFGNAPSCLQPATSQKIFDQTQLLEDTQISKSHVTTLNQEHQHWQFLGNELKDAVQEKNRLSLQYASVSHRALQCDQVKSDYVHLRETLLRVTKERDLALKGKHQLQAKLENLEQVLKHMREAAERRQQLELEHEQALAVLNAKQQEIELLQKAQVEAKKEHEGAVQLLEAKVRELEEKCRTQSEQFNLLSRELEKFRQQAGKIDLLSSNPVASSDISGSPAKSLSQLMNGIATSIGKGHESPSGSRCVISEFIRPLQISGDKPEQLSVKPTFLSKSRSGTPRCRFDSDMDNDQNSNTSKQRYSGKVHLCIARYSYNPFDGPNENPEAELPLTAGKYLYVYGDMDEDGFYEGELLDGQRGLVPSNFVDFVQDNETRLSSTLSSEQDQNFINHSGPALEGDLLEISPPSHIDSSVITNGSGTLDVNIDEIGEDIVPYPRKITLIKQLAKSVIVGWEPPVVPPGWGTISSYNVLVDKEIRMNIALGSRTKALIEKLNISTCTYRISIQSITNKGNSDELQCTLLVGKDVIVAPSNLKVDNITQISAELSWLPTNSNYSHVIFLNEEEFDIVKAASYKYHFFNLKPNMAYKVKVMAKPHQMPWQLPLEQREKKEAFVEFSTLPAGPPAPPQDVIVRAGSTPATVQVSWKPPTLTATGTSHGATVTGYGVYARGQRVAEVIFPTAENTLVELIRLRSLEAKEVTVRTLSAQGESVDSSVAAIPSDLLVPPTPQPRTAPKSKPLASAGAPETKEEHLGPHLKMDESWEQTRSASPVHGHTLEPPAPNFHGPLQGRRSPSPNRILPQPQGTPVPNTVAKAMAREAAQRVAESNRMERRSIFIERSSAAQYVNSDDEEDGYDSPNVKRRGASVDDFLKGSELGKQPHYCHGEEYHTESSRGSDLSDIMEEDEEELYSEMQLEEGGRRRVSVSSHNALKECDKNKTTEATFLEQPDFSQQIHHSKKLFSIPEVAEEDGEYSELLYKQGVGMPYKKHPTIARDSRPPRPCNQDQQHNFWYPAKHRISGVEDFAADDKGCKYSRSLSRSPDSGLDCGSEEEESRFNFRYTCDAVSASVASSCCAEATACPCRRSARPLLARRKTLTRQTSIEEDFGDLGPSLGEPRTEQVKPSYEKKYEAQKYARTDNLANEDIQGGWKTDLKLADSRAKPSHRDAEDSLLLDLAEITMDSNSEGGRSRSGSEGNISPVKEEAYYRSIGGHKKWAEQRTMASQYRYDGYGGHDHLSPDMYEESETDPGAEDISTRIFVALFDYDPLTMSPNPDAAEEELPFKEGQIIKVYGDKDADGFYRGETCTRIGLIPCNMVSEIQADDEEMMDQLLKQGFLPLNTPVEKIERNRRSSRQQPVATRRMVALYDYDPRESSPNVDVEAELTFCTGDIITVFGEIDEDGFYYGELNGQKGLVPSNFLEEVPDDVEVFLSDAPSRYAHDTPTRAKAKRVPPENTGTSRRAPSPTVHLHSGSPPSPVGPGAPGRGRDMASKKKKGLLSKGKKLLKRLGAVK